MEWIISFFNYIMDSEEIIQTGGLIVILLVIYLENGFVFGFFLPGDYLLFLTGMFTASRHLDHPIANVITGVFLAAVLGSYTNYISGKYFGDKIRNREDSLFFKKKYLTQTERYFDKYGNQTLIIARFLPVIRTFAPLLAGLVNLKFVRFSIYNIVGGAVWALSLVGGGYLVGKRYPGFINYVEYIIGFFLLITTVTLIKGIHSARKEFKED